MAKRNYEMTTDEYKSLNNRLIPYNIIIAVIAIVCTVTLFFGDFWKVKVKYELNESILSSAIGTVGSEDDENSVLKNLDYSVIEGLSIELSVSIKSEVLLTTIGGGADEASKELISSVITDVSSQVSGIMNSVLKASVKLFVSAALEEIQTQTQENFVKDMDLPGMEKVIDKLFDGATGEEIKSEIEALIIDIGKKAGLSGNELAEFTDNSMEKVNESVDSMMETLGDDGVISVEKIITNLLGEALGVDYKNISSEDIAAALVEKMDESVIRVIYIIMLILCILLLITAAAWGLLFLFAFIRLFTKKKTVYLGNARFFGWIPFSFLVILPSLAMWLVFKFIEIDNALTGLSLVFSSITLISFIGAVALMVLKWFGYRRIKKQVKYAIIRNDENSDESSDGNW